MSWLARGREEMETELGAQDSKQVRACVRACMHNRIHAIGRWEREGQQMEALGVVFPFARSALSPTSPLAFSALPSSSIQGR